MKRVIFTDKAPKPIGQHSQGVRAGSRVYVAGQTGLIPQEGSLVEGIEAQTRQAFENIRAILEAGGATMADVVKITAHLADMSLWHQFNEVCKEFFPDSFPVRTTTQSTLLLALVEIDVIAEID